MRTRGLYAPLLLAVCLLTAFSIFAQLPTATLSGIISDPQGAVVASAKVTAQSQAGVQREVVTGSDGRYSFPNLPPGTYDVRVEASGFTTREFKDVHLEVGRGVTLDAPLRVASGSEVLTVEGGVTNVNLTQSEVQGQISEHTVETIPLNGRNFLELAFLIPGNRPATNFDPTKTNTLEVSSAGQFGRGGNVTVDGGDNNDEVVGGVLMNFPQDAVHEFQIATNRYTAEVGRSASSVINVATKSGTNDLHGSAFVYVRNRNMQSRSATLDPSAPKPPFDRQQFGGSLGGALKKDRAWWFISGEDRHQRAAVQTGFRDFATQRVVTSSAGAPLDDLLTFLRLDLKASEHDNLYARWGYNDSDETANGSLRRPLGTAANRQSSLNRFNSWLGEWTRTLGPNKVNSLIFHANTFVNEIPRFPNDAAPLVTSGPYSAGALNLNVHNEIRFASLQDGGNFRVPQRTRLNTYQFKDNFALTHGAHTVHFGGEVHKQLPYALFDLFGSGTIFTTEDFATQDRNGDGIVNDLDIPIATGILSGAPVRPPVVSSFDNTYLGFFVQDDWRAKSNLTFNFGLRYELDTDVFGVGPDHDPCTDLTTVPTKPCVWVNSLLKFKHSRDGKDFSPRVGFAWDPFGKGQTVVRGGYGLYYDRVVLEVRLLELLLDGRKIGLNTTNGSTLAADGSFLPDPVTGRVVSLADPFGGAPSPAGIGINVIGDNARHPLVQQFTFGIQQQLGQNWVATADAVHNYGTRFLIGRPLRDANLKRVEVTDPCTACTKTPNPATNTVTVIESSGKNWYDGLLMSLQKRPTRVGPFGYTFTVNYTLSKSLTYANDDQIPFNTDSQADVLLNVNNLRLEKGYSPTDERHRLVFFGGLEAPWGISIAPIVTISSSIPMDSFVPALAGRLPVIARNALGRDIKTGAELNAAIQKWNALPECPGTFCRTGDPLPLVNPGLRFGDPFASADLRVTKAIKLTERQSLSVMAELFNITNTTNIRGNNNNNYSGRNNDITSSEFNRALSTAGGFFGAGGPRALQLALRYSF